MADITFPKSGKAITTSTKSVEQLKAEVRDRINQIHTTESEQSAYLSSDDIAELEKMERLLQGSLAILEQFEKTGAMSPGTAGIGTQDGSSANMKTGWNGGFQSDTTDPNYDEVIYPFNQGTDVKNGLAFKMDNTMESVKGKNVGTDIAFTVVYKDGSEKNYLIKDWVTNPTPFIVAADQTTEGVKVDLSQVKRISGSITILGGSGDDTLIGSQGDDQIFGGAGDDTIHGMGGKNKLDGGAGTDEIFSVNKFDAISGGDGYDTIHATEKEAVNAATFTENTVYTETSAVSEDNFSGTEWAAQEMDGFLSISKKSGSTDGGTINLTVPDGVMVYSKEDGADLILTYQYIGEDGTPGKTEIVKITGVLNNKSTAKITITSKSGPYTPSIIDLGSINTQYNQVTLVKGQGDDVIIAPKTALEGYGIKAEDIGTTSLDSETTKNINDKIEKDSSHFWASGDDGKVFQGWKENPKVGTGEITLYPKDDQEVLNLIEPDVEGYTFLSSIEQDSADKTTLTLFMKKDGSDQIERLVIHIKKSNNNPKTITVGGTPPHDASIITKFVATEGDSGGGVFVGDEASSDKSNAGDNKIIGK